MTDFRVQVDKSGRILLPLDLRKEINVKQGDIVVLRKTDNEIKLLKFKDIINEIHEMFAKYKKPGVSLTDEFIKTRREDFEREERD